MPIDDRGGRISRIKIYSCDSSYNGHRNSSGQGDRAPDGVEGISLISTASPVGTSAYLNSDTYDYSNAIVSLYPSKMKSRLSIDQLQQALNHAELHYLNDRWGEALDIFIWISDKLGGDGSITTAINTDPVSSNSSLNDDLADNIQRRAQTFIAQIGRGLDYHGLEVGYVPLVSLQYWAPIVERSIEWLEKAEKSELKFRSVYNDQLEAKASIQTAISSIQQSLVGIEDALDTLRQQVGIADSQISVLIEQRESVRKSLQLAEDDFKLEVQAYNESQGGSCDFNETIDFVTMVAGVGSGLGAVAPSFKEAIRLANAHPSNADLSTGLKHFSTVVGKIKGGITGAQDAVKAYQTYQNRNEGRPVYLMPDSELSILLEKYQDLPGASRYKELIEELSRKSQIVTESILFRDSLASKINTSLAQISVNLGDIESMRDRMSANFDPTSMENVQFMIRGVREITSHCVWLLRMEHKALEFWTLRPHKFEVNNLNSINLRQTHQHISAAVAREHTSRNHPEQKFKTLRKLRWRRKKHKSSFAALRETGVATLVIEPSQPTFAGKWGIVVEELRLFVVGAKVDGDILHVRLTHNGDSLSIDRNGIAIRHRYPPRVVFAEIHVKDDIGSISTRLVDPELGKSYLSPFGSWMIEINEAENPGLDRKRIRGIEFEFTGYARALSRRPEETESELKMGYSDSVALLPKAEINSFENDTEDDWTDGEDWEDSLQA